MLAFPLPRPIVRPAQPGETALISYLRQAALWCLDMVGRSPATVAAFLDRVPDVDSTLVEEGRYFVAEKGREILGGAGWSPLGTEMRAWLFGEHSRTRRPPGGGEAALIRGFFLHDRSSAKAAGGLIRRIEAQAAAAGFGSAEIIVPAALQGMFLALGFDTEACLEFGEGADPVPLVHMSKVLPTAFSEAA